MCIVPARAADPNFHTPIFPCAIRLSPFPPRYNRSAMLTRLFFATLFSGGLFAQPNPYRTVEHWYHLPEGRTMGSTSAVAVAADGHIWVAERCGANSCRDSQLAPVLEFDQSGTLLRSWGAGMFVFPHGLTIDKE